MQQLNLVIAISVSATSRQSRQLLKASVGISIKPMYFITVITTHNSVKTTVIQSLKCHFRKLVLLQMIEFIVKKEVYSINLLDAVPFVHKAWEHVTEKTIRNCFRHAGIIQEEVSREIECSIATTEDDDLPLSKWVRIIDNVNFASCDLNRFSSVNDDILTIETAEDNCDGNKKSIKECIL